MRLVFAGTPPFAARALLAIREAGHEIVLVLTQPDRPSGRGMKLTASAVAKLADEFGLTVAKLASLKPPESHAVIAQVAPEIMVVAAYGLLLPKPVLTIPLHGCLNIHASLLPRWRGAAPVQRAILAGDTETGVAIMQMESGLDVGPVLLERRTPIFPEDTAGSLTDRLADLGAQAVVDALGRLDSLSPQPQAAEGITYAAKLSRNEAPLDWSRTSIELDRQVRAFNPFPGAEALLGGEVVKVWKAHPVDHQGPAGTVVGHDHGRPVVACGTGALVLTLLQRSGSRQLPAEEFLKARPMPPGTILH